MVPNQRADSSACLSLRSLRLNEARFNSLERVKSEGRKKAETRRPKAKPRSASGLAWPGPTLEQPCLEGVVLKTPGTVETAGA